MGLACSKEPISCASGKVWWVECYVRQRQLESIFDQVQWVRSKREQVKNLFSSANYKAFAFDNTDVCGPEMEMEAY